MMLTRRELLALVLVFLVTLPAVTPRLYASDEVEYFAWLRSIAFDRDVDFENEYQYFYDAGVSRSPEFHETFLERTNEIGRRINYAPMGSALLWSPFYAVGHVVALARGAPADGFSQPYVAAVAYASACYGFLAVVFAASIARRVVGSGLAASLIVALGTPLVFYMYIAPGFAHATSAFAVSLFLLVWLRVRERWTAGGAIALGLCAGLMATVREQDLLLAAGPAIDFLVGWRRAHQRGGPTADAARFLLSALTGLSAFVAAYAPQLAAYNALNGHPGPTETAVRKMTWTSPHALSVLFSPEHGLLAWTPLVLLALAGLGMLAFSRRADTNVNAGPRHMDASWIATLCFVMAAMQVYSSGSVESWTVAGSFGQRRFIALTPILTIGIAAVLASARGAASRLAWSAAIVLCIWWNLGLMAQFGTNRMDRQRLTLRENARVTYLELPFEAPAIAWRYLTDRGSFYKLPRQ